MLSYPRQVIIDPIVEPKIKKRKLLTIGSNFNICFRFELEIIEVHQSTKNYFRPAGNCFPDRSVVELFLSVP